jgi:hypothetical protein
MLLGCTEGGSCERVSIDSCATASGVWLAISNARMKLFSYGSINFSSINVPGVTTRATLRSNRRPPDLTLPVRFVGNSSLIATYLFKSRTSIFKNLSSWKKGKPAIATGPALVFFQASFKFRRGAYCSAWSRYSCQTLVKVSLYDCR